MSRLRGSGGEGPACRAAAQGAERGAHRQRRRYLGREGEDHRQQRERREQQHQQPPRAPHLLGHCRQRRHLRDRPAERASPGLPAPGPPAPAYSLGEGLGRGLRLGTRPLPAPPGGKGWCLLPWDWAKEIRES